MKTTLTVIKADIGSIGGHTAPSKLLEHAVRAYVTHNKCGLFADLYVSHTGDDIAILMAHDRGVTVEGELGTLGGVEDGVAAGFPFLRGSGGGKGTAWFAGEQNVFSFGGSEGWQGRLGEGGKCEKR